MKKIAQLFIIVLVLITFTSLVGWAGELDNTYELNCEVVSTLENEVAIIDPYGEMWVFEQKNVSDYHKGDKIEVRFHTNFTPHNRRDDMVRKVWEIK